MNQVKIHNAFMKYIKLFENIEWDWIDEEYPDKPDLYILQFENDMVFYLSEIDPINRHLILYKNYKYENGNTLFKITDPRIINNIKNDTYDINCLNRNRTRISYSEISKKYNIIF